MVVIFEENASYGRVIGNADAPFFNQLAGQCALATNYHEVAGGQPAELHGRHRRSGDRRQRE